MKQAVQSDSQLMQATASGDQEKFSALYRRYYKPVLFFVLRWVRSRQTSEDISQEVFARIWKYRHTWYNHPEAAVKTWIFQIAKNTMYTNHLSEGRLSAISINQDDEDSRPFVLPDRNAAADRNIINTELARAIAAAIDSIPDHYRRPWILYELGELSYIDISTTLDVPVGTVKSRISRAREHLQYKLRNYI